MPIAHPDIAVLIPTFNRRDVMVRCLAALAQQSVAPERIEIVVVDDGSSDGTAAAVTAAAGGMASAVHVVSQANAGANAARNRGIGLATAPLLLIINDDTIATPDLVGEHLRLHASHPADEVAVLGQMVIAPELPFSVFHALHHEAAFAPFAGRQELDWKAFYTSNVSVKRRFLDRVGRFDEALRWHEDIELGERLAQHGLRLLYNPAALAYHLHMLDEAAYLRIAEREGRALVQWYARRPDLLADLVALGFNAAPLGTRRLRHVAADLAITRLTYPLWCALARALAPLTPEGARIVYRKLFQWRKRQAITAELELTPHRPPGLLAT